MIVLKYVPSDRIASTKLRETVMKKLCQAGVIVFPTETAYGLGADATNERAIARVYRIKKRDVQKPLSIVVKDIAMADRYAVVSPLAQRFLERVWPGPVTVILRKRSSLPDALTGGGPVGLRCSPHPFLAWFFSFSDTPLTATSANISGEQALYDPDEVIRQFKKRQSKPDVILDAGKLDTTPPSTVVDLTGSEPKILRVGPVTPEKLKELFDGLRAS